MDPVLVKGFVKFLLLGVVVAALAASAGAARITDCRVTDSYGLRAACGLVAGADCRITD